MPISNYSFLSVDYHMPIYCIIVSYLIPTINFFIMQLTITNFNITIICIPTLYCLDSSDGNRRKANH